MSVTHLLNQFIVRTRSHSSAEVVEFFKKHLRARGDGET